MLKKELGIFTFSDLLNLFPYRHVDKTRVSLIRDIYPNTEYIQVAGKIISSEILGEKRGRRLVAQIRDSSGILELTWFQGIPWIQKSLKPGNDYLVFGRVSFFLGKPQITHPEMELLTQEKSDPKQQL